MGIQCVFDHVNLCNPFRYVQMIRNTIYDQFHMINHYLVHFLNCDKGGEREEV